MDGKPETKRDFSCGGVVWDAAGKKLLLVKVENLAGKQVWTFPKGHPEEKETDQEAALREVQEETGWACEIVKPVMDVQYFYTRDKQRYIKTVRWFLMRPLKKTGDFNPGEILQSDWFSLDEVPAQITYDSDRELLKKLNF